MYTTIETCTFHIMLTILATHRHDSVSLYRHYKYDSTSTDCPLAYIPLAYYWNES